MGIAHFLDMFFKPKKINFIAISSFGNDWQCFMIFLNGVIDRLRGNFVFHALVVYTAFLRFPEKT
jgi:hypothetical protein